MAMDQAQFEGLVARMERFAADRPAVYRRRVFGLTESSPIKRLNLFEMPTEASRVGSSIPRAESISAS